MSYNDTLDPILLENDEHAGDSNTDPSKQVFSDDDEVAAPDPDAPVVAPAVEVEVDGLDDEEDEVPDLDEGEE